MSKTDWHKKPRYRGHRRNDVLSSNLWLRPGTPVEKARSKFAGTVSDELYSYHNGVKSDYQYYVNDAYSSQEYLKGLNHKNWNPTMASSHQDVGGEWLKYDQQVWSNPLGTLISTRFPIGFGYFSDANVHLYSCQEVVDILRRKTTGNQKDGYDSDRLWLVSRCPALLSNSALDQFGTIAIAQVEPTHPATDISSALGELLHDGLPSIPGSSYRNLDGNIGEEYLNYQFGIAPTVSDGRSFIKAIRNADRIALQYSRDSGRIIRRGYSFPLEEVTTTQTVTNVQPSSLSGAVPTVHSLSTGTLEITKVTTKNLWFSGAFMYHIPENALGKTVSMLDRQYGVTPDFETAWNLMPWSWLVDWFSNAQFVIHNMDAFSVHGLVMPYGYVMCDQVEARHYKWTGYYRYDQTWYPLVLEDSVTTRSRQRRQANPFGFGLSWDGLDSFQLSILAALGVSRR